MPGRSTWAGRKFDACVRSVKGSPDHRRPGKRLGKAGAQAVCGAMMARSYPGALALAKRAKHGDKAAARKLAAARPRSNPSSRAEHLRDIILPTELDRALFDWHGGQFTAVYSLASTGINDLVSRAMIDRAQRELEVTLLSVRGKKERRELKKLIGELRDVRMFWKEFSAKEAGLSSHDSGDDGIRENPSLRRSMPGTAAAIAACKRR